MADTVTALQLAARAIDQEMIMPLRQQLIGRKIVAENPRVRGTGVYNVEIRTMGEVSAAMASFELPRADTNRDVVKVTRTTMNVPVLQKNFEIPRMDFEAFKNAGIPIDTASALSAAYQVGVLEDSLIFYGWKPDGTNYVTSGLYTLATNDFSTSKDFATFGNPTSAVGGALALIEADNALADAYNLILNPVQANELRVSMSSSGIREIDTIKSMINGGNDGGAGKIYSTPNITAGTGMLVPVDPARRFVELYVPQDIRTVLGTDSRLDETSPIYGSVYELVLPHVKYTDAICKLSSI